MSSADPFAGLTEAENGSFAPPASPRKLRVVRDIEPSLVDVRLREGGYIIDGRPYPRVSAILNALPRQWLADWRVNRIVEYAVKTEAWRELARDDAARELKGVPDAIRDTASARGIRIHSAIQARLTGRPVPMLATDEERQCMDRALRFLAAWGLEVQGVEVTVWSDRNQYAGTLDIYGTRNGERWLLDWKTGTDAYVEHAIQVATYQGARWAAIGGRRVKWGPIDRAGIVHVRPDGCTLFPVVGHRALLDVFEALRVVYDWQRPNNPNGLGEPETFSFTGFEPEEDMSIIVSAGNDRDFPPHPEGQWAVRCIDIIDLGKIQSTYQGRTTSRHRGILRFYAGQETEPDKNGEVLPLWIDQFVTMSLHSRSRLRKLLEAWRGQKFTDEELEGFDLEVLLGKGAYIQVSHNAGNERVYANIDSIMKLPKGVQSAPMLKDYVRVQDREPEPEEQYEDEPVGVAAGDDDSDLPF